MLRVFSSLDRIQCSTRGRGPLAGAKRHRAEYRVVVIVGFGAVLGKTMTVSQLRIIRITFNGCPGRQGSSEAGGTKSEGYRRTSSGSKITKYSISTMCPERRWPPSSETRALSPWDRIRVGWTGWCRGVFTNSKRATVCLPCQGGSGINASFFSLGGGRSKHVRNDFPHRLK